MKTPSILIVEPEISVRHSIAEYLRECGYQVVESASTDEAIQFLTNAETSISIVLADVSAPDDVDGFGLAKWMRQKNLDVQIILAGSVSKAAEKAGEICEHGPLLAKPYHHQTLLNRIKGLIALRDRNESREG